MAVDPTDPETFADENATPELDVEAPEDDAAEQSADVTPDGGDPLTAVDPDSVGEADVADVIEQARVVSQDEDDYR